MKKIIFALLIVCLANNVHAQTIIDSLKGCYAFTGNDSFKDGTSVAILASYNAIHFRSTDRFNGNNAIKFSGAGYLSAGTDTKFNMKKGLTISAWVYIDPALTGEGAIVSKWDNSTGDEYLFGVYSNNKLALALQGKTFELTMLGRSVLPDTTWTHVAMTWEVGGMTNIYVNGIVDTASILIDTLVSTSTQLNIGGQGTGMSRYFNGKIDDIRIYSRALSATEIGTLYSKDSACGLKYTPPPASVNTLNNGAEVIIYPNPATDKISLSSNFTLRNAEVYDMKGSAVLTKAIPFDKEVDINSLQQGIYILRVTDDMGKRYVTKFIKE